MMAADNMEIQNLEVSLPEAKRDQTTHIRVRCHEHGLTPVLIDGENYAQWLDRLSHAFGTEEGELARYILENLARADDRRPSETTLNALISAVREAHPRDTLERMLVVQMFLAAHRGMTALSQSSTATLLEDKISCSKIARRFMYLYARELEALRKYRNSGQQTITVVHADKAIVGNVVTAGGTE